MSIPDRRGKALVTHINRLKDWKIPQSNVYSVVMAKDSPGCDGPVRVTELGVPILNSTQAAGLQALLVRSPKVICGKLGNASPVSHTVDTGQANPVQIHPYRIAPAWRGELRKEIF